MIDVKPTRYALEQNTPNPFNPSTMIAFKMPVEADWTIEVFNVAGQLVRDYSGHSQAGTVEVMWDGTDNFGKSVASGIYFYRARADQFSETKKMVLMK
jgi:flagellar hook assembly protein FlgD